LASSDCRQVIVRPPPSGVKRTPSMSSRSAVGSGAAGPRPRETLTVGMSWRKFDTVQRIAGNAQ
jgi:hypothetical protein